MNVNNKAIPNGPSAGRSQSPNVKQSAKPVTPTYTTTTPTPTPTPKFTPPPVKK